LSDENKYKVTAIKWRPQKFKDVVFQNHVTMTLTNAIKSNRIAHAYLFCGPRGVGKTTIARIFSRAVNCLHPVDGEPCDECENCRLAIEGRGLDIVEIDGASNRGIDDMRNLQESARYTPSKGKYKVFIIDEIHMITREGFNAFLKTLEEPPEHIIFIGATTEPIKVYPTIISRCQRFDFKRIPVTEIIDRLKYIAGKESIVIDEESLLTIAKKGDGSLRDSQSIFDQVVSSCGNNITFENLSKVMNLVSMDYYFKITDMIKNGDTKQGLILTDFILKEGYDLHEFLIGLLDHFRNLLLTIVSGNTDNLEVSLEHKNKYKEDANYFSEGDVLRIMKLLSDVELNYKYFNQPRLRFEMGLLQIIRMSKTIEIDNLLKEIEELKKKAANPVLKSEIDIISVPGAHENIPVIQTQTIKEEKNKFISLEPKTAVFSNFSMKNSKNLSTKVEAKEQVPGLNLEIIKEKWNNLLDEVMKFNKISIRSILLNSTPVSFENNTLTLDCIDAFHAETITNNKSFIVDRIESVFGTRFNINPSFSGNSEVKIDNPSDDTGQSADNSGTLENNHPIIQTLMREFDAEPII
jgi:DNA polymerase III subunit gamma/tau